MAGKYVEKDSVVFEDLRSSYASDQDIFVAYTLGKDVQPTSRDWIGLYRADWISPKQYLAFEWAPKNPRNANFPAVRSVLFRSKYLHVPPNADVQYQFMYVTKNDAVLGRSSMFRIYDIVTSDDDTSLECVERHVDGAGSVTLIRTQPDKHKGLLETFELIRENEPDVLEMSTQVKQLYRDQSALSGSFSTKTEEFDLFRIVDALDQSGDEKQSDEEVSEVKADGQSSPSGEAQEDKSEEEQKDEGPDLVPLYNAARQTPRRIREKFSHCKSCKERKARSKQLQHKMLSAKLEAHTLKHDLKTAQEKLALKEVTMGEMSSQLKSLLSDNANLTNTNNALAESVKSLNEFETDNFRLSREMDSMNATLESLMAKSDSLAADKELADYQLGAQMRKNEQLTQDNRELCGELSELRCAQCELEAHLDDVMYTLSLQGYTTMISTKGDVIDLTKKNGRVLELRGSATSKCTQEKHEETIDAQAQMLEECRKNCDQLTQEMNSWKNNVMSKDKKLSDLLLQLSEENNKILELKTEANCVENKLADAVEREESTRRELLDMKKEKSSLLREHEERETRLKLRIKSLQESLRAARVGTTPRAASPQRPLRTKGCQTGGTKTGERLVSVKYGCDAASPSTAAQARHHRDAGITSYAGIFNENIAGLRPKKGKAETRRATPAKKKSSHEVKSKVNKPSQNPLRETKYGVQSSAEKFFAEFEPQSPLCSFDAWVDAEGRSTSLENEGACCADVERHVITAVRKGPGSAVRKTTAAREVSSVTTYNDPTKSAAPSHTHQTLANRGEVTSQRADATAKDVNIGTNNEGSADVKHRTHRGGKGKQHATSVQIVDSACSRCGLVFPPGTSDYRVTKHKYMHAKYGY